MKQLFLATALIVLPVGAFTAFNLYSSGPSVAAATASPAAGLGDMSAFSGIVTDVQAIAAKGDLAAAKTRIKDFETAWDDQAATLRALDGNAWGTIDDAADAALGALRAGTPDATSVDTTLAALQATLTSPVVANAAPVAATLVSGIAVTDTNGRALPCEVMLKSVADGLTTAKLSDADRVAATGFQTKALERCNADDDQRADGCRVVSNYGSLRVGRCFAEFVDLNYGSQARPALRISLCLQMKRLASCDRLCRSPRPTNAALYCRL